MNDGIHSGGCTCGRIRYTMEGSPLVVHACHCTWCQRETGAAFAVNAMIEAERVRHVADEPELLATPSASGRGQVVARCPSCRVALWSNYPTLGALTRFVRVGTLDLPHSIAPDIHIFTETKRPWVVLPPEVAAVPAYYDRAAVWPAEALDRLRVLLARAG